MSEPKKDPLAYEWPVDLQSPAGFDRPMTWTGVPDTRPSWGEA